KHGVNTAIDDFIKRVDSLVEVNVLSPMPSTSTKLSTLFIKSSIAVLTPCFMPNSTPSRYAFLSSGLLCFFMHALQFSYLFISSVQYSCQSTYLSIFVFHGF